jgi:alpha-D-ribose 1-methylphosphonate 5-triphosphate synthase subunit PhnH
MVIETLRQAPIQQRVFRALVEAYSRPGTVQRFGELIAGEPAWLVVLATLLDVHTTLADPHGLLDGRAWPMLESRRAAPEQAAFVLCDGARTPEFEPALGSLESPEHGATLMLRVAELERGDPLTVSGPGVDGSRELAVTGLERGWLERRAAWVGAFPLGVEFILADGSGVAALPRTSRIAGYGDDRVWAT